MRKLTIKKEKSRLSRFSKTRICIYDPNSTDIKINKQPYRILGILKNGEEKTFPIDDSEIQILAFNEKSSRHITNDVYTIPAGTEDITLTGKDNNSLTRGTFEFDNSTSNATLENRKEQKKTNIILFISIILAVVFAIAPGCSDTTALFGNQTYEQKTFTVDEMQIVLPSNFSDHTTEIYETMAEELELTDAEAKDLNLIFGDAYLYSDSDFIIITKETFEEYKEWGMQNPEALSLEEYFELVKNGELNIGKTFNELKTDGNKSYVEHTFTGPNTNKDLKYITFLYKTDSAFWMVSFATIEEYFEVHRDSYFNWEETIEFTE